MSTRTIDLFLITGFLGSGKTTFLCHLLDQLNDIPEIRAGVLMNEYGSVNVDRELLPQDKIVFSEINGGSIFCNCLHSEFIQALKLLFETSDINTLFLETSGLSNPSIILQDLDITNKQIGDIYKIKESISLVDASLITKLLPAFPNISTQIEVSSRIIINKIDLIDSNELDIIKKKIHKLNPNAKVSETKLGQYDLKSLYFPEEVYTTRNYDEKRDVKGRLTSITLIQFKIISEKEFSSCMREIRNYPMRVKGYIQLGDQGWYRVDQIDDNFHLTRVSSPPNQRSLVFILKNQADIQKIKFRLNNFMS